MANEIQNGCLYIVATPIGNLSDISERAKKTLAEVDFVAAEDTRVTGKLLSLFGIKKSIYTYFDHNKKYAGEKIIEKILSGESCALVTDAGTPAISDPGTELVALARENGISVFPVPGPSAVITALCASGFDSRRFVFEGFLPQDNTKKDVLDTLMQEKRTTVFYEAPHRLYKTLKEIYAYTGERKICLARELTKLNEEFCILSLSEAIKKYEEADAKGEFVIIIEGKKESGEEFWKSLSVCEHVNFYIDQGMQKMDAIKLCAKDRGVSKNTIYKELL